MTEPTEDPRLIRAAAFIAAARLDHRPLDPLPAESRLRDVAEGYATQGMVHRKLGEAGNGARVGYKIGCTTVAMQELLGIPHPCAGGIIASDCHRSGVTLSVADYVNVGIEVEIAMQISGDLPAHLAPFDAETVATVVGACMASLEIVDARASDFKALGVAASIADDFAGAGCVLGPPLRRAGRRLRIAAYDFGLKRNILRGLVAYGCEVRVFPAAALADELLAIEPDGVFLSNGPGDPAALPYAVAAARAVLEADVPVFGICLGHQVLAQAMGGTTYKLKFGHRGANHPVKQVATGQVEITSQNHGFAVDPASLPDEVEVPHLNLYDGTVEGLRHTRHPAFCVQYHPEASPGPHDADYLFSRFLDEMDRRTV